LIKFQGENLPNSNHKLGHSFANAMDTHAKFPNPLLTPKSPHIVPEHQWDITPKSLLKKTKIWKPGEHAHHFGDDSIGLDMHWQKQGITTGLSAKTCIKITTREL